MQTILYFENGCLRMTLDFLTSLFWECLYIGWECLYIGWVSVHWLTKESQGNDVTSSSCLDSRKFSYMLTIHYIAEWNTLWGRGLAEVLVHSLTKESQGDDVTQRSKLSGLGTLPFLRTTHTLDQYLQYYFKNSQKTPQVSENIWWISIL